jgi:hypothetical protein
VAGTLLGGVSDVKVHGRYTPGITRRAKASAIPHFSATPVANINS